MEKRFFDTNIYNHIDNSQLKLLKSRITKLAEFFGKALK